MPVSTTEEPGAVKQEDSKHRSRSQPVDIVSSIAHFVPPHKSYTNIHCRSVAVSEKGLFDHQFHGVFWFVSEILFRPVIS
jgi:hypothetical protein